MTKYRYVDILIIIKGGGDGMLKDYLKQQHISIKAISDHTGIAYSTVNYIVNNRTPIEKCTGETIYKIARYLNISMDKLYEMNRQYTLQDFEVFKSEISHAIKSKTQIRFLLEILQSNLIEKYWEENRKVQALYLLSMVDYISRLNNVPVCTKYKKLREARIEPMIIPLSFRLQAAVSDIEMIDYTNCIPEFLAHGIVEGDVFNVF